MGDGLGGKTGGSLLPPIEAERSSATISRRVADRDSWPPCFLAKARMGAE
jgi:hypothetical protein